ncbi:hypothetical protein [Streptomyces phaeochromogenes]|uniref:hypothetical protein n=1 Tax=Streptomyces phaeochromogenes TaxID=1923 RepID=UPI003694F03A
MSQTHLPGTEAEVDFGDVRIVLAGVVTRCCLFSFRLLIDEILLIDLDATRKQRHTVTPDLPPSDRRALLVRGVALTT